MIHATSPTILRKMFLLIIVVIPCLGTGASSLDEADVVRVMTAFQSMIQCLHNNNI